MATDGNDTFQVHGVSAEAQRPDTPFGLSTAMPARDRNPIEPGMSRRIEGVDVPRPRGEHAQSASDCSRPASRGFRFVFSCKIIREPGIWKDFGKLADD